MFILKKSKAKFLETLIKIICLLSVIPVFLIIAYILYTGIPAISWEFLTQMPEDGMRAGGIFPAIVGTLWLTFGTIIVAVPFGILTGVYLVEYAKDNLLTRIINLTIINLAGIPSIIYGLFGMALFVIYLNFDVSILSGSLTLGIMCLPVIITATRESLLAIPKHLREASLALGATKWETITKVILPAAMPGILTGVILSISRAAGETAPIMFTAGWNLAIVKIESSLILTSKLFIVSSTIRHSP